MAECLRCGRPAEHVLTIYDPFRYAYVEVRACEACYTGYTPRVDRRGGIVWRRTKPLKTYLVYTVLGSRRAALKLSALLDRVAGTLFAKLYITASAYTIVALSIIGILLASYSTIWYTMNIDTPALDRVRQVFRSGGLLAGTGLLGLDPFLPLLEVAIPFILALTLHELGHALVLRFYGYDVRRFGVFLIGPIPGGAFVETPGDVEARMGWRQALQLAGSGVTANLMLGLAGLAAFLAILSGVVPLTTEAAESLTTYISNPRLILVPPLILSAMGLYTPMTAPPGWYTHSLLGDAYTLPLNISCYMATINFLLALFNSLPIKQLDGGYMLRALLFPRLGPKRTFLTVNYVTAALASMIVYTALVVRV